MTLAAEALAAEVVLTCPVRKPLSPLVTLCCVGFNVEFKVCIYVSVSALVMYHKSRSPAAPLTYMTQVPHCISRRPRHKNPKGHRIAQQTKFLLSIDPSSSTDNYTSLIDNVLIYLP